MGGLQDWAICFIFADMDMTIMLAVGFFGSAEFYILLAVVAAAIVAAAARPAFTGPVREELLAAELLWMLWTSSTAIRQRPASLLLGSCQRHRGRSLI